MTTQSRISDAEMRVLEKLWSLGTETAIAELTVALREDGEIWTHQTVATFLKRLNAKGVVCYTKKGKSLYYFPKLSKEAFYAKAADHFVKQTFQGSLTGFLSAFSSTKPLSNEEIQALKDWLDEIAPSQ